MIDTKRREREKEWDKHRFPLEFNEEKKRSMKVTSTIDEVYFRANGRKKIELTMMATGFSLTKTNIFFSKTLFLFFLFFS